MAYVGPPGQYDVMGATQFSLLFALGLRSSHRVLDFGCGSLRAGRLLLVYLDPERYFGVEPNRWLIDDAIANQLGEDLVRIKRPSFDHGDRFEVDGFGVEFDFILAQSIFSHAGPEAIGTALRSFKRALRPDGLIALTFKEGDEDYAGEAPWVYPNEVFYRRATIEGFAERAELAIARIPWFHPRQTWYLLAADPARLPSRPERRFLRGAVLDPEFAASYAAGGARRAPEPAATADLASLAPIVVGGIGGSGTRAVTRILRTGGAYLGSRLNHAEDALDLGEYNARWIRRWLTHPRGSDGPMRTELAGVLHQHLSGMEEPGPWGWKVPKSILLLPFLDGAMPQLRFVHVIRDGRDMAFSENQTHLRKHGDAILGDTGAVEPRRSIALWAEINERAATYAEEHLGDRYLRVRFEDLCADPETVAARILDFGGLDADARKCAAEVEPPASIGRWRARDAALIAELEEVAGPALRRFGYLSPAAAPQR